MSQASNRDRYSQILDSALIQQIGVSLEPSLLTKDRAKLIKENINRRIKEDSPGADNLLLTTYSHEGSWIEVLPRVEKKVLNVDPKTNIESFLLRIQPGGTLPRHPHARDELCLMLEGEVMFGDLCLKAGDFHMALKGSIHETVRSDQGALIFIQS